MEMARKALVAAFSIGVFLLVSAPSMANFYGPGFDLNGLPCGWGLPSTSLGTACGLGPVCGSGMFGTAAPLMGCGTIPSCAIAGSSYAGSPGVYCSGFGPFAVGVPVPVPACLPAAPCPSAPVCVPAIVPAAGLVK
jgi:hypothetical protein